MHLAHGRPAVIVGDRLLLAGDMGRDQRRGEEASRQVMQRLPAAGELEGTPGGDRPAVVELPVQCAHAAGHAAPVLLDAHAHALRLVELRQKNQRILVLGKPVLPGDVIEDDLVANRFFWWFVISTTTTRKTGSATRSSSTTSPASTGFPKDQDALIFLSQLNQAECMRVGSSTTGGTCRAAWAHCTGSSTTAGRPPPGVPSNSPADGRRCITWRDASSRPALVTAHVPGEEQTSTE